MPAATPPACRAARPLLACLLLGAARVAFCQTDEIQVYDAEITAPGSVNLTWHNNFTPAGRGQPGFPDGIVPDHALNGVPEWAYGVSDWFEAGLYLPVYTRTADGSWLFDGMKLRALFAEPNAATRTFFYGVNFELSYNSAHWDPARYAGEIRPIVGWHLASIDLIVNPIIDTDFNGFAKLDFAPALRAAWHLGGKIAVALEEYSDLGPLRHFRAASDQQHTLFAVFDYGSGSSGLELGIGKGLTRASDSTVLKLMLMHDL